MKIPSRKLEEFVRELCDECLTSQVERTQRGQAYKNYFLFGAQQVQDAAIFNKTFAYIDDLESMLYSPLSLRFNIGNPELPNVLSESKGRAASTKLRHMARKSDTDTLISGAVCWSLVKGKAFIKQTFKGTNFSPELIQPESMGVLRENHDKLDADMEAFVHRQFITPYQFARLIEGHPDEEALIKKSRQYVREAKANPDANNSVMQVIVGGLQPFQPAGGAATSQRGIVDWMGGPTPVLSPNISQALLPLDELWVWDDKRKDWATFLMIGSNMLILGKYFFCNALAWNATSRMDMPELSGRHPFVEFSPNRLDGYFWGRSEIANVALLQEMINKRINGINRLLRLQEDPPKKYIGSNGVNQAALTRFNKPGGYWTESNPNAKVETMAPEMPPTLFLDLHEAERMFDEMGGLPPIAKGHGESGVRSAGHAETLVRMFSPRFKDRALLVERDVEALGALMLDLARVHVPDKLVAWVDKGLAGVEAQMASELIQPPAPNQVGVYFTFADLDEDVTLTVDSHSSSPVFAQEAKGLVFDLLKIGAMTPEQVVEHVDAPDPDGLIAGIQRREASKAAEIEQLKKDDPQSALKMLTGGKKK